MQAGERGVRGGRHHPDPAAAPEGRGGHAAVAGPHQGHAGAWSGGQGQLSIHRPGEVHEHAQKLPQHPAPGGLLLGALPRPDVARPGPGWTRALRPHLCKGWSVHLLKDRIYRHVLGSWLGERFLCIQTFIPYDLLGFWAREIQYNRLGKNIYLYYSCYSV